jgi:hypothetical protein
MHAPQDEMPLFVHLLDIFNPLLRRRAPRQKDHAIRPHLGHDINHLLSEQLPPLAGVRVCFVFLHRETRVQHQDTAVRPRCQQTAPVRRLLEVRIVLLERRVYILERGWGRRRRTDGEAEAVGLVWVVVGILACDYCLDGIEWRMARPVRVQLVIATLHKRRRKES